MTTSAVYYENPLNIDYLIPDVRFRFGDLEGTIYSDTIIRTSIVNAVKFLQNKWYAKYLIYSDALLVDPQPVDVPAGYKQVSTRDGLAYVPDTLIDGDVFRNPYIIFNQAAPPTIESYDEEPIVLAAVYLLRLTQTTSSSGTFVSWKTEDLSYSNLGIERTSAKLLQASLDDLNTYFGKRLGKPLRSEFPISYP